MLCNAFAKRRGGSSARTPDVLPEPEAVHQRRRDPQTDHLGPKAAEGLPRRFPAVHGQRGKESVALTVGREGVKHTVRSDDARDERGGPQPIPRRCSARDDEQRDRPEENRGEDRVSDRAMSSEDGEITPRASQFNKPLRSYFGNGAVSK